MADFSIRAKLLFLQVNYPSYSIRFIYIDDVDGWYEEIISYSLLITILSVINCFVNSFSSNNSW